MDWAGLARSILRQTAHRLIRRGVDHGVDVAFGGPEERASMTPEERAQAKAGRQAAKRMRQAGRILRMLRK